MHRRNRHHRDHHIERRQQPAQPTLIEARKGKVSLAHLPLDDTRDQESRYHEEQIDADEAAEHPWGLEMKADHRQHRERAQSVNVFTIAAI